MICIIKKGSVPFKIYNGDKIQEVLNIKDVKNKYNVIFTDEEDIKLFYDTYIKNITDAYKCSNGLIKIDNIENNIFNLLNKFNTIVPTKIQNYELPYLLNCGAGVRIAEKYKGPAYHYDICSYYPYLLQSNILKIPISEPDIVEDVQKSDYYEFGIYNASIECDDEKIFTVLKSNFYTHYEMNKATKLNLKINILGPALIYKNFVPASQIFKKYVDELFVLKKKYKNPIYKQLINQVWGLLCQTNKFKLRTVSFDSKLPKNIIKVVSKEDTLEITTACDNVKFKNNFGRMKPFILGLGRVLMHTTINRYKKDIVYSHTDSIVSKKRIPLFHKKDAGQLGKFKFVEKGDIEVKNKNTRKWLKQ